LTDQHFYKVNTTQRISDDEVAEMTIWNRISGIVAEVRAYSDCSNFRSNLGHKVEFTTTIFPCETDSPPGQVVWRQITCNEILSREDQVGIPVNKINHYY
jgi:hypothetical protein